MISSKSKTLKVLSDIIIPQVENLGGVLFEKRSYGILTLIIPIISLRGGPYRVQIYKSQFFQLQECKKLFALAAYMLKTCGLNSTVYIQF